MTGYRAFSYNFVKTFPVLSKGFEIETEMSIHSIDKNMHVENVVIEYRDRPEGSESKLNTFQDGFKVINTIVKLFRNYKPLAFYTILSVMMCVLSTCFLIPVLAECFKTGLVLKFPTLIVCCFVYLSAIISFFVGMLLSNSVQKNRHDFEMELIKCEDRFKEKCKEQQ